MARPATADERQTFRGFFLANAIPRATQFRPPPSEFRLPTSYIPHSAFRTPNSPLLAPPPRHPYNVCQE